MANECGCLGVGSDHDAGGVAEEEHRQPERFAELQEPRRLVGAVARDRAREVHRIVGDDPDRPSLDARERGDHAASESGPELERRIGVGKHLDRAADVVGATPILGNDIAEPELVGRLPRCDRSLEERQRLAGETNGIGLVVGGDVDHAVANLHVERADVLGGDDAEAASLDHRGTTHADARVRCRDDEVAAPEQQRVAGEASPGRDADARHEPGEPCPEREGHDIKTGDHRVIGVTGTAAATLREEHDRQSPALDDIEQAVLLAVTHDALRARQHGVVVREDRAVGSIRADGLAVDPRGAADESVGRCAPDEIVDGAPSSLRCDGETAVLDEGAFVDQVVEILTRGPASSRMTRGDDILAARVAGETAAAHRLIQVGARCLRIGHQTASLRVDDRAHGTDGVNTACAVRTIRLGRARPLCHSGAAIAHGEETWVSWTRFARSAVACRRN